jgi:hypothetical protein
LVQVALIDLLAQIEAREAAPAMRKLASQVELDESVRARAASAEEKLGRTQ